MFISHSVIAFQSRMKLIVVLFVTLVTFVSVAVTAEVGLAAAVGKEFRDAIEANFGFLLLKSIINLIVGYVNFHTAVHSDNKNYEAIIKDQVAHSEKVENSIINDAFKVMNLTIHLFIDPLKKKDDTKYDDIIHKINSAIKNITENVAKEEQIITNIYNTSNISAQIKAGDSYAELEKTEHSVDVATNVVFNRAARYALQIIDDLIACVIYYFRFIFPSTNSSKLSPLAIDLYKLFKNQ